ncbi:hypothetical protein DP113_28365 [Brasilonema octagenarum UFV-E1]|uniref:Uncharacterized protein n=1 Tax=Brasilonema sennae CENA114 TaxID=415709 RepID=A0A856MMH4_9CYAN|nr:hypothetical protein DP114_28455 [Brasilonema sennae CENA114]QDL17644.1 hypothetical protein DP113_28365 [Brasilonema octagenarum UFV-E1]
MILLQLGDKLMKFFSTLKLLLEKSHMSPRIEIAETHVSVHSSHHTPPGHASGGSLIIKLFFNSSKSICKSLCTTA